MVNKLVFNSNPITKKLLILCVVLTSHFSVYAQRYFSGRNEFGVVYGVSNYYGDLAQGQNVKHFHPSYGVYQRYNLSSYFSLRNQLSYLKISGTTEGNANYAFQNLNFKSDIYEFASMLSFDFHSFGTNVRNGTETPYAILGLSMFYFDPTRLENSDLDLREFNTENRSSTYSPLQFAVPIGIGYKTMGTARRHKGAWVFGIEAIWRKTFIDYLDDVDKVYPDYNEMKKNKGLGNAQYSQAQTLNGEPALNVGTFRGDVHLKDWYYFYGFNLSYRFTPFICR